MKPPKTFIPYTYESQYASFIWGISLAEGVKLLERLTAQLAVLTNAEESTREASLQ